MGTLLGGIYATGDLSVYAVWVMAPQRMQVLRLLDPIFGRDGFFKGEIIVNILRKLTGDRAIEELPVAFTPVATDLAAGKEVWLHEGRLLGAMRASTATRWCSPAPASRHAGAARRPAGQSAAVRFEPSTTIPTSLSRSI